MRNDYIIYDLPEVNRDWLDFRSKTENTRTGHCFTILHPHENVYIRTGTNNENAKRFAKFIGAKIFDFKVSYNIKSIDLAFDDALELLQDNDKMWSYAFWYNMSRESFDVFYFESESDALMFRMKL